ncbi:hypothetical protein B0H16DRAFT_1895526 [Mycena metata]|uniref:Tropomyosin n=1 Tax=Mycena metata TaxID=1033252 RepID=A0AAD7MMW8_9AGAR|nr:hypothetical protein B0H16DRAFT_1895526 [Mycena metata]
MTDRVRERLVQLRSEVDAATLRAETAEDKVKHLEQTLLEKDNDIKSLSHKLNTSEEALDKAEAGLREANEKLRSLDVKAEQAERQQLAAEKERDQWEAKCEARFAIDAKYKAAKIELDNLVGEMEGL